MMSDITTLDNRTDNLFNRISELIEQSRRFAVNAVNVAEVRTRFEVGRYIFEDEQRGERATYGQQVLKNLSARLMEHYGNDWSYDTLVRCRKFYQAYEHAEIVATALPQLEETTQSSESKAFTNLGNGVATIQMPRFTLTWSHYLILMRIENKEARSFYDIDKSGISRDITNILKDGELQQETTVAKIATVVNRGIRGKVKDPIDFYNLDMIIAVGYRVSTTRATGTKSQVRPDQSSPSRYLGTFHL